LKKKRGATERHNLGAQNNPQSSCKVKKTKPEDERERYAAKCTGDAILGASDPNKRGQKEPVEGETRQDLRNFKDVALKVKGDCSVTKGPKCYNRVPKQNAAADFTTYSSCHS